MSRVRLAGQIAAGLEFADWARVMHGPVTVGAIRRRFRVSRATGYRYLATYHAHLEARARACCKALGLLPRRQARPPEVRVQPMFRGRAYSVFRLDAPEVLQ